MSGASVETKCAQCGTVVPSQSRYCLECGSRLARNTADGIESDRGPREGFVEPEVVRLDEAGEIAERFTIRQGETTIGRLDADISFPDDFFLSPIHAKITFKHNLINLRDLGSRNGTWWFLEGAYRLQDGDRVLIGSQILWFRKLGYPGPHPPELDQTRRLGSLTPSADIASLTQLRADGSYRDVMHLSPGRDIDIGREVGEWTFPYDPSMSGKHARITSEDADFILEDAGSRNGTAVAVRGDLSLDQGSRFLLGDKMLRIELK